MNATRSTLAMAAMLAFVWMAHGDSQTVSAREMASWTLTIAADASETERYAAEEFQRLFREVTTISLPLRADGRESARSVTIGAAPSSSSENEGFTIRIEPEQIEIKGGSARAALYGVYAFAEQYLGVRFLSADNTYFPRDPGLGLPCGEVHDAPVFSFRSCFYAELTGDASFASRLRINTVQGEAKLGGCTSQPLITHSLFRFVPVADFGAAHPEYFALVNGRRKLDADGGGPQVCSTNPEVIEIVAQAALREIAEQPSLKVVYVSQNDNGDYCECPACASVDEREGTHMGAHLALVNAVAKRVAEKHPDVKVGTLAYWYTRRPPRFLKPEPNVQIQFCAFEKCPFHAITDRSCPRNRAIKRDMNDWLRIAPEVYAWDYVFNLNAVDMPFADLRTLGPNLRYYAKRGVRGAFIQGNGRCPGGELSDLRCYVVSKLLWNPQQDEEALIAEFLRLHYGESAGALRAYLDLVDAAASGAAAHASILSLAPELGLTATDAQRGLEIFDKALISADNDIVRARVVKASLPVYKAAIETSGRLTYANGRLFVAYPDWMQDRFREYSERCAKIGMDRSAEFASLGAYLDDVRRNRDGVDAVRIENDTWRVTLIPPMNGTIVELYHKPTGRDMLNALGKPGINLRHGVIRETFTEDLDSPGTPEWGATPASATIVRHLPDGTIVKRFISLEEECVRFATDIEQMGNEVTRYQIEVSTGFHAADQIDRLRSLRGQARIGSWRRIPVMSFDSDAEDAPDLPNSSGIAWFNRMEQSGASIQYPSGQFESPLLFARPGLLEVSAEMTTPERTLNTGETLRIEYTIAAGPVR